MKLETLQALECFTCWEDFLDYFVGSYFLFNIFGFGAGQVPNFLDFCTLYSETGWLKRLGARGIVGAGMVHLLGGFSGSVGSYFWACLVHIGIDYLSSKKPEIGPSLNFLGLLHTLVRNWIADSAALVYQLGTEDFLD